MNFKNLIFLSIISIFIYVQFVDAQFIGLKQEHPKSNKKFGLLTNPNSSFTNTKNQTQKVEKLADRIINTLELNDSEAKSIRELCEDRSEKIEKIKLNSDNSQQKIFDLQAVNQDFDAKIKQLVSANQYQKYEVMRRSGN
jgi:exopolysaccharide biosynthesis protein